jgi:hypothetical protein
MSFKFILDPNGNRPPDSGTLNTDTEVYAQIERGNTALAYNMSELRIQNIEIVDVSGISSWYNEDRGQLEALREAAIADPTLYAWRNDAINVYINGYFGGGRALYPDNDIIIIGQNCTGDALIHEMGHSFSLYHTHEEDFCSDTITDDDTWNRDDIAVNYFGDTYANLLSEEQDQVDIVWFNIMSYHPGDVLSHCQMDRMSLQGYSDKSWLYSKEPVYVNNGSSSSNPSGTFEEPYEFLDSALNAGNIDGKVIVLQQGSYTTAQDRIDKAVEIVPRFGEVTITRSGI